MRLIDVVLQLLDWFQPELQLLLMQNSLQRYNHQGTLLDADMVVTVATLHIQLHIYATTTKISHTKKHFATTLI